MITHSEKKKERKKKPEQLFLFTGMGDKVQVVLYIP